MKFLFVNTWNGDGYSDPNVIVKDFTYLRDAIAYALKNALDSSEGSEFFPEINRVSEDEVRVEYSFGEDSGCVHVFNLDGLKSIPWTAIKVYPMVNQIVFVLSSLYNLESEVRRSEDWDGELFMNFFHLHDDGYYLIGRNQPYLFLDYDYDQDIVTDGIESETWVNELDGIRYSVPIEIVRDFKNMEKI